MPWFFAVVEAEHAIQNPTSPEKIRLLGERMRLGPQSSVLDVGSGRAGPAVLLAETFGCRVTCLERSEEFNAAARRRAREANVDALIEVVHADARAVPLQPERYDVAICLGASFIWEGLAGTLAALVPTVRRGGFVAVGEPYWRRWPPPKAAADELGEEWLPLPATVERLQAGGLAPVTLIDASLDDWDRYETLHWLAAEEWLDEHPDDPDAKDIRSRVEHDRERYLRWQRELLGWAIIVGRKR